MDWFENLPFGQWFLSINAEQWTAVGSWATVAVALGASIIGLRQVGEARRLRVDQAQPYVVAIMEQSPTASHIIEIAFRNFGATAARNIVVRSTPRLRCTDGNGGVQHVWVPDAIPMLAPGQEWRTFWDDGPLRLTSAELRDEDSHRIDISYDGVDRSGRQTTTSVLDWAAHRGRLFVQAMTMDDAATALRNISKTIAKWSDSPKGLAVFTRDGEANDMQRAERASDQRTAYIARRDERAAQLRQFEGESEGVAQP